MSLTLAKTPDATPLAVPSEASNQPFIADNQNIIEGSFEQKDYFKSENGLSFAGIHLIIDLWNAKRLDDLAHIEHALKKAIDAAGATLLHFHLHHFSPNGGVSGVAVLAESHISIHTWPEKDYAALDVFMCGDAEPHQCVGVLAEAFGPDCRVQLTEQKRGLSV